MLNRLVFGVGSCTGGEPGALPGASEASAALFDFGRGPSCDIARRSRTSSVELPFSGFVLLRLARLKGSNVLRLFASLLLALGFSIAKSAPG